MTARPPIAVIGTGTMGAGIAQLAAQAGHEVMLLDRSRDLVDAAVRRLSETFEKLVAKGKLEPARRDEILKRLHPAAAVKDLARCGWAIEAVAEDLGSKRELFGALDQELGPEAILASNTSSL